MSAFPVCQTVITYLKQSEVFRVGFLGALPPFLVAPRQALVVDAPLVGAAGEAQETRLVVVLVGRAGRREAEDLAGVGLPGLGGVVLVVVRLGEDLLFRLGCKFKPNSEMVTVTDENL